MKKLIIIIALLVWSASVAYAIDCEKLYKSGVMKESEWREHEARSERWFKARNPEYYDPHEYNRFQRKLDNDKRDKEYNSYKVKKRAYDKTQPKRHNEKTSDWRY